MTFNYNLPNRISQYMWIELLSRLFIILIFFYTESLEPFYRVIQPEEFWLYRFPTTVSYVPSPILWIIIIIATISVILLFYAINKDPTRAFIAFAVPTLALPLTGIITNLIKVSIGRPRPDFLNRCYGDSYLHIQDVSKPCIGPNLIVLDGRKSFPSGHSSMSFCGMGFIFLYVAAQLGTFNCRGRGKSLRLMISLLPLMFASMVAISRTCDYHHHWQDITVGSILGFSVVYIVYRQYFPSLSDLNCADSDIKMINIGGFEQGLNPNGGGGDKVYNRRGKLLDSPTTIKTV